MKLVAYDKQGNYVDSMTITENNKEDIAYFYMDFHDCRIVKEV